MKTKKDILENIKKLRNDVQLLMVRSDAGGTTLFSTIDIKLNDIEQLLKNDIERYGNNRFD